MNSNQLTMDLEIEVWLPVKVEGCDKFYLISNYGKVKSLARRVKSKSGSLKPIPEIIMKPSNYIGYDRVMLCTGNSRKWYSVHRLVALTFISNPNNYPVINHIDGDKTNNHYSNLEWCTVSHNTKHAYDNGKLDYIKPFAFKKGQKAHNEKIVIDLNTGVFYENPNEIALLLGVKTATLRSWLSGSRPNKTSLRYA